MAGKSRFLILRIIRIANHLFELVGILIYCVAVALKKFQSILDSFSRRWGMCYKGFPWSVPPVLLINSYFGDYRISTFINKRECYLNLLRNFPFNSIIFRGLVSNLWN